MIIHECFRKCLTRKELSFAVKPVEHPEDTGRRDGVFDTPFHPRFWNDLLGAKGTHTDGKNGLLRLNTG